MSSNVLNGCVIHAFAAGATGWTGLRHNPADQETDRTHDISPQPRMPALRSMCRSGYDVPDTTRLNRSTESADRPSGGGRQHQRNAVDPARITLWVWRSKFRGAVPEFCTIHSGSASRRWSAARAPRARSPTGPRPRRSLGERLGAGLGHQYARRYSKGRVARRRRRRRPPVVGRPADRCRRRPQRAGWPRPQGFRHIRRAVGGSGDLADFTQCGVARLRHSGVTDVAVGEDLEQLTTRPPGTTVY